MSFDHALTPPIKNCSPAKLLAGVRHDLFYTLLHRHTDGIENIGDTVNGFNWNVRTRGLGPHSIVYSAGVGRDISFEHALANRFGTNVVLLDPSPTGLETMEMPEHQRAEFMFLPVALAGHRGEMVLSPPGCAEEGSWISETIHTGMAEPNPKTVTVKCETVSSLMEKFGHKHVDLLKIDIEGAEYEVLDEIMSSGGSIRQIAVEFHNGVLPGIPRSLTIKKLVKLYRHGYRIIHKGGSNHTLMHRSQF